MIDHRENSTCNAILIETMAKSQCIGCSVEQGRLLSVVPNWSKYVGLFSLALTGHSKWFLRREGLKSREASAANLLSGGSKINNVDEAMQNLGKGKVCKAS